MPSTLFWILIAAVAAIIIWGLVKKILKLVIFFAIMGIGVALYYYMF